MDVAAFCDYCGRPQTWESLVDHQAACKNETQLRVEAAFIARHGAPAHAPATPDHSLPGAAAELPIAVIASVFRETKQIGGCPSACEILPGLWLGSADVARDTVFPPPLPLTM